MTLSPELPSRVLRGSAAAGMPVVPLEGLLDPMQRAALDSLTSDLRQGARAEGYAVGWAEGRRAADEAAVLQATVAATAQAEEARCSATALASALRALTAAADALEARAVVPAAELADAVVTGAFELAQALLGRELSLTADPGLDALRRALVLLPENRPVTARMNPDDASVCRAGLATASLGREVLVVSDPTVEPGGAIVACDSTRVDAQLGPAIDRVREVLGL
jgi:flagellar assembly protein FliH